MRPPEQDASHSFTSTFVSASVWSASSRYISPTRSVRRHCSGKCDATGMASRKMRNCIFRDWSSSPAASHASIGRVTFTHGLSPGIAGWHSATTASRENSPLFVIGPDFIRLIAPEKSSYSVGIGRSGGAEGFVNLRLLPLAPNKGRKQHRKGQSILGRQPPRKEGMLRRTARVH